MPRPISEKSVLRVPLSRERVLRGASEVADVGGLAALTIRSLADHLGVKPMSVYHYVANKDEILDGIVDIVYSEIALPTPGADWQTEIQRRSVSARAVLRAHPWAIPLVQSRLRPGPATLTHLNAVIGTLRTAGFSLAMTAHAFALIDSYVFGFALSEAALPINGPDTVAEVAGSMLEERFAPAEYPHLLEFTLGHVVQPGYNFGSEFGFGLGLVLEGLRKAVNQAPGERSGGDP